MGVSRLSAGPLSQFKGVCLFKETLLSLFIGPQLTYTKVSSHLHGKKMLLIRKGTSFHSFPIIKVMSIRRREKPVGFQIQRMFCIKK